MNDDRGRAEQADRGHADMWQAVETHGRELLMRSWGARRLIGTGLASLTAATVIGGLVLAVIENAAYADGLWWSFSVVSTTGFEGPPSTAGKLTGIGLFAWAVVSYVTLIVGAFHHAISIVERRSLQGGRPVLAERDVRRIAESIHLN